jgi:hypothetical protein
MPDGIRGMTIGKKGFTTKATEKTPDFFLLSTISARFPLRQGYAGQAVVKFFNHE